MLAMFLICALMASSSSPVKEAVDLFHQLEDEQKELAFIKAYKNHKTADIQAYVIALEMKRAKYKTFPWVQLKIFYRSKNDLDRMLSKYPENIHLRYIRYVVQSKTPAILGYKDHIKEDRAFLMEQINTKKAPSYLIPHLLKNIS